MSMNIHFIIVQIMNCILGSTKTVKLPIQLFSDLFFRLQVMLLYHMLFEVHHRSRLDKYNVTIISIK
jgi:hypothetical protein